MAHMPSSASAAVSGYSNWVMENPGLAQQLEEFLALPSYFVGSVGNGDELGEFIYAMSRLVAFANDSIIRKLGVLPSLKARFKAPDTPYAWLLVCLNLLDYTQVCVERQHTFPITGLRIR